METQKDSKSGSSGFWDGIIGAIGQVKINVKWYLPFQCDVGTGDTDLTWQVFGGVGYKLKTPDLVAGYRPLGFNFDSGDKGCDLLNGIYISERAYGRYQVLLLRQDGLRVACILKSAKATFLTYTS